MGFTGSYLTHLELQLALKCSSVPRQWVLSRRSPCCRMALYSLPGRRPVTRMAV